MALDGVGTAILRLQADQSSIADTRVLLQALATDPACRDVLGRAGALASSLSDDERRDRCLSMSSILLSDVHPPEVLAEGSHSVTAWFTRDCTPPPRGEWERAGHIKVDWTAKGKPKLVQVSDFLRGLLLALEGLWNIRQILLE